MANDIYLVIQTNHSMFPSPVNGKHHFLKAGFDFILCFQVSHALCWLSIYGQDHVSNAKVSLSRFTSWGHLKKNQKMSIIIIV